MNKEDIFLKIINETISNNSYLGDDCAFLEEFNLVVSQDTLIEDVHFKTSYFTPFEIAKKAVLVNISDILANGGIPKYITISLSGNLDENFIKDFYLGVNEICNEYKIKVVGGDLTKGDKIAVSICILGDVKNRKILSRKNANKGDLVYLAGFHGSSAMGLIELQQGKTVEDNFIKAHKEPKLFPSISKILSEKTKMPCAVMDTSDGLYDALYKISISSNVGFEIEFDKIPKQIKDKNLVLFGGEDFGLLICINPVDENLISDKLQKIGKVTNSNKILIDGIEIKENKSFQHFK